ncbi:MAG: glucose 1-dehydrogenase [Gemmatimonas sp.]|nr:glucose 1-dehydrogenase [Gemmatimonas sp.]
MSVLDLFRLEGRTAIVTGGGRGLGEYMARGLSEMGAKVVLCSRKLEACQGVADEISREGGRALALACDVASEEEIERVVAATAEEFGIPDIVINNSGATWGAPPDEMPLEKFDHVMAVNVRGTFLMSRSVASRLIADGRPGSIINIASVAAFKGGRPGMLQTAGYSASKGAIVSLTRELAGSWSNARVRVNAIAPGWFPTKMSRRVLEKSGDRLLATIPLGRFGEPADIQCAAIYLASDASSFVTGQTIVVDGGQTIW